MARLLRARVSDEQLARQVSHGRKEAFAELYKRHHQALFRYCRSILRDPEQAQDVLQSAMASAFVALGASERDLAVRPWLFRIVHNEAISLLRRRRSQDVEVGEAALIASADDGPERTLEQHERLASLLADLRALAERQRSALLMRELSGLTIEEIAQALSITPATAKQTLFEARSALRDMAEGRTSDCDSIRRLIGEHDGRVLRSRLVRAHLRSCAACQEYEQAIATRSADLRALAPPLPAFAASVMLARLLAGSAAPHAASAIANGAGAASSGLASAAAGATSSTAGSATAGAAAAGGTAATGATAAGATSGLGAGFGVATSAKAIAALALVIAAGAGATHFALSGSGGRRPATGHHGAESTAVSAAPAGAGSAGTTHAPPAGTANAAAGHPATKGHPAGWAHPTEARGSVLHRQASAPRRADVTRKQSGGYEKGLGRSHARGEGRMQGGRPPRAGGRAAHEGRSTGSVPRGRGRGSSPGNAHARGTPRRATDNAPPGQAKDSPPTAKSVEGEGASLASTRTQTAGHPQGSGSKQAH